MADYRSVVYNSSLTDEQDEMLDGLQNHALRCIFGTHKEGARLSGRALRAMAEVPTLRARREEMCLKFANKCVMNPIFDKWFPRKTARAPSRVTRKDKAEVYLECKARCERLKNLPFFYFRRILNGKVGKNYGSRYANYRED